MILILFLLIPSLAFATPLTYTFTGESGAGLVNGSFTYDAALAPIATNVRGLLDNAVYGVSSYSFTAQSNVTGLPTTTFAPATSTIELCQGHCIFGTASAPFTSLLLRGNGTELRLSFAGTWGAFSTDASYYKSSAIIPVGTTALAPWALMIRGQLTAVSTPEPSTLWLLLLVLPVVGLLSWAESRVCGNGRRTQS